MSTTLDAATPSILNNLVYYFHGYWIEHGDPRTDHLPLVQGGPWKVCLISFLYWYFIRVAGPAYMKNRPAFDLRPLMLLHNAFLIGVNGVGFLVALWVTDFFQSAVTCKTPDPSKYTLKEDLQVYLGYIFFLTKIVDFGDTIFFILRKKLNQASFLHVFHHGAMPIGSYMGIKLAPIGFSAFLPAINIFVHFVMYSYYAMACAGPDMKKHLWWKKHITQMQLVQFVLLMAHSLYAWFTPACAYWPRLLAILEGGHAILFFYLFGAFYKRVYWDSPQQEQTAKSQ